MKKKICILMITVCWGCNHSSDTEKYQNKRDHILFVKEKIKELEIEDVLIGQYAHLYIMNDYLLISDPRSVDEQIYIFNKNNFNYITNTANRGQGPGEIASMGFIGVNEAGNLFYVTDHGKQRIFSYSLDSVLTNPLYMPEVKMVIDKTSFPDKYQYINDTLFMGVTIEPTGNSGFNHAVAKINTRTGEISRMPYKHPGIERKRICFAMSAEHGIYVECYHYHDLMTVCSLDGDLKYNIYGRKWNDRVTNKYGYYENVVFCNDKIIASCSDGKDRYSRSESGYSTQFLVFNTEGDYIRTLETGYSILDFCYDKDNNRIIMSLNAEIQFAYLDLDGLLE
jgi:hypothetical protein